MTLNVIPFSTLVTTLHNVCAVHRGMFSILGDIIEYTGGVQYTGGISLSTPGGVQYIGGYHEYTGGVQYSAPT